ncbi:helix-turn-helix domain-containing protein [Clostridium sp. CM028]|uniref:helix-turn-helix domain-containing protein n=1 Tax=Clostridium sp. CM028 TaxID=2851575 RepID=UPI001C6E90C8|nr:helix-turn-helix transcriptional regulator [Clostridium sp. CM028]MBW9149250.1 helix-turn-helix domain-containing protein [Clostridium sp. CM028]WLC63417.1 helix-turn-helix domain-containing protein [Clostridium sp. CM028]
MSFSEKLQTLRKEKGLSQEQLGEVLNVSRQSISKWESGQTYPEINKLIILSDLFEITLDDLVKDKNIGCTDSVDDEDEGEEYDRLMIGCMMLGTAIGCVTGNFMWATAGGFLGLGVSHILKEFKRKI